MEDSIAHQDVGVTPRTLTDFLALADPLSPAIGGVEGSVLRYDDCVEAVDRLAGQLIALGIQPGDRVAIVLPNGPEVAILTLAVAACATATPLNPGYKPAQLEFYLSDLRARIAITGPAGPELSELGPVGMEVVTLAGALTELRLEVGGVPISGEPSQLSRPDDVALVLHTSGTTARPKQVPLTHRNLAASAANVARTLKLGPDDHGLNVMPLFHIHGLVAGLFASMAAGASVTCTPGFDALRFNRWRQLSEPTWFTAVPTMYQLLLARAPRSGASGHSPLRFVRSSSAPMPAAVLTAVEDEFGAAFIEAYGMTEAAHQMTSNPLPPGDRKPGSVGFGGLTEIRVMLEDGSWASAGEEGEAVVRGECVTSGYVANPEANANSYTDGWFRTGDLARLDDDGYLFITGRLKEIINRGGTKISPREIDEVLLGHPDVLQATTFAIPHRWLGEDVAAAIVLRDGSDATSASLRTFAGERLVANRVPATIVLVEEIPKGPTGKLQRIGLAEALGLV